MFYIDALELINMSVKNGILKEQEGMVFVYRAKTNESNEGWSLTDKALLAQEIMRDEDGQEALINALKEKEIDFEGIKPSFLLEL